MARDKSLQDLLDEQDDVVEYFFNETIAPHFRARTGLTAAFIPPAFTNWRDEQRGWAETAVLFDQSHHMPELFIEGPDATKLLEGLSINSFSTFDVGRAKQFVSVTPRGHVIGDCVAYRLTEDRYELISGMAVLNWVQYQAELGGYDVSIERDDPTPYNPKGRRILYRYQLDGPNARAIFEDVLDEPVDDIPFFRTARVSIAGKEVLVLRHGMAGQHGYEISGPYDEADAVRGAILAVGEKHGLVRGGTQAYFSTLFESGWMAYPLPAIFTGEELRGFREWLSADGWEANSQLGGSFRTDDIEDYYVTPYNLGYGKLVKFDHDFIGREALEALDPAAERRNVTLVWNRDDVVKVLASQLGSGPRYKSLEFPVSYFGFPHLDEVRVEEGGAIVGLSAHVGYSNNEGDVLSLAYLDPEVAAPGTEVIVTWGEPGGGSRKPHVEKHEQTTVRAVVAPSPYTSAARQDKGSSIVGS
ncbi:aminomethyl transferase family protein [Microbacterium album]|uniref:Glycine cleavage system protein T n=1 Tax=Microbacterium album TaxID=2053191 RepID=A0A917IHL2_9MICO|nr:aminomethyl transferase family protein [Microbacterium album]GGH47393.1 glycine cleavage system protein T [Microbacterium album]